MFWFDNNGHVYGHLNLRISNNFKYFLSEQIFCCNIKIVDYSTHKIHKIKCSMNKNDFTVSGSVPQQLYQSGVGSPPRASNHFLR